MSRYNRVGKRATTVSDAAGILSVRYHATEVVRATPDSVILDTGGWRTNTTKTRMNQASHQYGLGYTVFQKDYHWFVNWKGQTMPFVADRIELV